MKERKKERKTCSHAMSAVGVVGVSLFYKAYQPECNFIVFIGFKCKKWLETLTYIHAGMKPNIQTYKQTRITTPQKIEGKLAVCINIYLCINRYICIYMYVYMYI